MASESASPYSFEQVIETLCDWEESEVARLRLSFGGNRAEAIVGNALLTLCDRVKETEQLRNQPRATWPEKFTPLEFYNDGAMRNYFRSAIRSIANRRWNRAQQYEWNEERDSERSSDEEEGPLANACHQEDLSRLPSYLDSLPQHERDAVTAPVRGESCNSVAKRYGVSVATVSRWANRGRRSWKDT